MDTSTRQITGRGHEVWRVYLARDQAYWSRAAVAAGQAGASGVVERLRDLPAPPGAQLMIILEGSIVRLHSLELPVRHRRRLLGALGYLLEERLLGDPELHHFVAMESDRRLTRIPVAVIETARMADIVECLRAHEWQAVMLAADYLAVPAPEADTWFIDAVETPLLLRTGNLHGSAVLGGVSSLEVVPGALRLALRDAVEQPRVLRIRVRDQAAADSVRTWQSGLDEYGVSIETVVDAEPRADWLLQHAAPAPVSNLLNGPWRMDAGSGVAWRRLWPTAALAAGLVLVLLSRWLMSGQELATQHEALLAAQRDLYLELVPDARNIVDPRFQMEQLLAQRTGTGESGAGSRKDLLSWLEQIAVVTHGSDREIRSIDYDGQSLSLVLTVKDYETLDRLRQDLERRLPVVVESAELRDGRVQGRLRIGGEA